MFNHIENNIRKLAKSVYWQTIYNNSQKCASINLFENTSNFSYFQMRFLYWLATYNSLYESLATYEDDYLTENVIEDNFRCDAYLTYKGKKNEYLWKQYRQEEKFRNIKNNKHKKFKNPGTVQMINVDFRKEDK